LKDFPVSGHLLRLYSFSPSIFSMTLDDCYMVYDEIFSEDEELLKEEFEEKKGGSDLPPNYYLRNNIS
jgi:hypothetical protein